MNHYALVLLMPPTKSDPKYADWSESVQKLKATAAGRKDIETLGESSWLIPRDAGIAFLGECLVAGSRYGSSHRIWFLDGDAVSSAESK